LAACLTYNTSTAALRDNDCIARVQEAGGTIINHNHKIGDVAYILHSYLHQKSPALTATARSAMIRTHIVLHGFVGFIT
jgi:hypothetical protein